MPAHGAGGSGAPSTALLTIALLAAALLFALLAAAPALAAAPVATIEPPTEIGYYSAHLKGQVNPEGGPSETCWRFEIVEKAKLEAGEEGWNWANFECMSEEDSAKAEDIAIGFDAGGLHARTVYLVRLTANNGEGESTSAEEEFETKGSGITPPEVHINAPTGATGYAVTFTGTVNPEAPEPAPASAEVEDAYRTTWRFECEPSCDGGSGEIPADDSAHEVEHEAHLSILPNRTYLVKLVAENAGGKTVAETTFDSPKLAPDVSYLPSAPASIVTDTGVRLAGFVDTHESGEITECRFEYGTTAAYGSTVPCDQVYEASPSLVTADITGLSPDTAYHFRLTAVTAGGTDTDADNHFITFAAPPAEPSCPNEAVRIEQKATMLPGCRAWEMVSPPDKNGGNVELDAPSVHAAADGNGAAFVSRGSFADTQGAGGAGFTQYISRRGTEGWETHALYPVSAPNITPTVFDTSIWFFSEDLSHALLKAYDLPNVTDDLANSPNAYWEDTATRETRTITKSYADTTPNPLEFFLNNPATAGSASADLHVVAFQTHLRMLPEAPEGGVPSVYEWEEGGALRLASILPDGSIAPEASTTGPSFVFYRQINPAVSRDGSLVAFLAPKEGSDQLYVRRNHTSTAWVSEPEGSAPVTVPKEVALQYISPDSKHVLFTTSSQLVDEDENSTLDLYMYTDTPNPASEQNLTLISNGGLAAANGSVTEEPVLGTSSDASFVYYHVGHTIYLWRNGSPQAVALPGNGSGQDAGWGSMNAPQTVQVSPDGRHLAFLTEDQVDRIDETRRVSVNGRILDGADYSHGVRELYVYDAEKEMLFCASCSQAAPGTTIEEEDEEGNFETKPYETLNDKSALSETAEVPGYFKGVGSPVANQPRFLSADGEHVYFSTAQALVPEDRNEAIDVYEYDVETGQQKLISSGRGEGHSALANTSPDGSTVFFATEQPLVGRDSDTLRDLYAARVDGGFAEPPPPPTPCVGDGCRGPIPHAPENPSAATPRFFGPGDPKPRHPRHPKHRRHHRKKHHHHHHRGGAR